jgi:hypothetical protein
MFPRVCLSQAREATRPWAAAPLRPAEPSADTMAVPDGPEQPVLPFDPPLASASEPADARPDGRELGADLLSARLFEEFASRSARLDRRPSKPHHAA